MFFFQFDKFAFTSLALCFALLSLSVLLARTWTDITGKYTVDAELIGYTEKQVILQRTDHHLAAVDVEQLSQADKDYLATEEARLAAAELTKKPQTWTTRSGVAIIGKVVDYASKQVIIQRRRGKVYVNDRVFDNLPEVYQRIVPLVVGHFEENAVKDKKTLIGWLTHKKGAPQTYQCDGVVLEMSNGDEYAIPFFLLSESDLSLLKPGWKKWTETDKDYQARKAASTELQSLAAAQRNDAKVTQQIARLQLGLQAVEAGVTSLWEVTLYPGRGVAGPPLWVVVPGRDSRVATASALKRNPGYVAGPVRRVSN